MISALYVSVRVCVCSAGTKGWPRHLNCAQCSPINTPLSLETNIGPPHLWTCSSTSLIQVHFFSPSTLTFSPSQHTLTRHLSRLHLHVSTQTVTHSGTLCQRWGLVATTEEKKWDVVRMNICITMSASGLSQCQPFKRRLREDWWIIEGPRLANVRQVAKSGLNYCDEINFLEFNGFPSLTERVKVFILIIIQREMTLDHRSSARQVSLYK